MTGSKPGWKSVSCMPTWSFLPWRGRCCSACRFLDWACIVWSGWKSTQCNEHTSWGNLMHLSPMLSLGMMVWSNDFFLMSGCIRFHADIPLSCGCMYWRGKLHSRKNRGSLWTLQVPSYLLLDNQSMFPYRLLQFLFFHWISVWKSSGWAPSSSGCTYCGSTTQTSKIVFIVLCCFGILFLVYLFGFHALFGVEPTDDTSINVTTPDVEGVWRWLGTKCLIFANKELFSLLGKRLFTIFCIEHQR